MISLHRDKKMGPEMISRIIPVHKRTIARWISNFAAENSNKNSSLMKHPSLEKDEKATAVVNDGASVQQDVQSLQAEIARLKKELRERSLCADLYKEMINVAESQFNISILKKAGTKR